MRGRMTKTTVNRLQPDGEKASFLWDTELRGFGAKALPSGQKGFIVQYRHGGASWRYSIGKHGPLTVNEARRRAKQILGRVAAGENPAKAKQDQRAEAEAAVTLGRLAELFVADYASQKKRATAYAYASVLRLHIVPIIGGRRLAADIDRRDARRLRERLKHIPVQANRAVATLSRMYSWGEQVGHLPLGFPNPAKSAGRYSESRRERFLSSGEFAALGTAIAEAEAAGEITIYGAAALRLLCLTGMRRGEVTNLTWDEVDFERGRLNLKDSKVGSRSVPLGAPALELLAALPRVEGEDHVIVSKRHGCPINAQKVWAKVKQRVPQLGNCRLHDLRHALVTFGAARQYSLVQLGALVGHSSASMTARYEHLAKDADAKREWADDISAGIAAAMAGRSLAKVTTLRGRR